MRGTGMKRKAQFIILPRQSNVRIMLQSTNWLGRWSRSTVPVEKEAEHLSRVESRLGAHNIWDIRNGWEDGVEKDAAVRGYG